MGSTREHSARRVVSQPTPLKILLGEPLEQLHGIRHDQHMGLALHEIERRGILTLVEQHGVRARDQQGCYHMQHILDALQELTTWLDL